MLHATLTLEEIVSRTPDLPTIPAATFAVMRETESPTGTAQSVARCLAQDQSLAVRVLRLSNSAYYGLSRRVMDVPESVVVLGMRAIRNLAMVASTYPWLTKPLPGYSLQPMELWAHSFGVAVASQVVADETRAVNGDQAFTAGLLHNLGKVALSVWLESRFESMIRQASHDEMTFDEIEREALGYDHAQVGAHMAAAWNLPHLLENAIRYHHIPNECPEPLVDCVHVADYLAMSMGFGLGIDGLRYGFETDSMDRLGLSVEKLDDLADKFMIAYDRHGKLFEEKSFE